MSIKYCRALDRLAEMHNITRGIRGGWWYGTTPIKFVHYMDDNTAHYSMYGWELGPSVPGLSNTNILLAVIENRVHAKYLWRLGQIITVESEGLDWFHANKLELPRR